MREGKLPLYNPKIVKEQTYVAEKVIKQKLEAFYSVYNPSKLEYPDVVQIYLDFAKAHGVYALMERIKNKYSCSLDSVDNSPAGWKRIYKLIKLYCEKTKKKYTEEEVLLLYNYIKANGLLKFDEMLESENHESFTKVSRGNLDHWKNKWKETLQNHHEKEMKYKIERFMAFLKYIGGAEAEVSKVLKSKERDCVNLYRKKIYHVNETLLEKYGLCLNDVNMLKGNSHEERIVNLKMKLIEFFQHHDQARIDFGDDPSLELDLMQDCEIAIVKYEEFNDELKHTYGSKLEVEKENQVKKKLREYMNGNGDALSEHDVDKLLEFARKKGFHRMNESLVTNFGDGQELNH
eukprot:snap_masked-scaffold_6-processed-gene-11.28-mRNA-1 protein AED:1.00 eAED:1.00 QI:0/0/0/0/1/1/2/0/347